MQKRSNRSRSRFAINLEIVSAMSNNDLEKLIQEESDADSQKNSNMVLQNIPRVIDLR